MALAWSAPTSTTEEVKAPLLLKGSLAAWANMISTCWPEHGVHRAVMERRKHITLWHCTIKLTIKKPLMMIRKKRIMLAQIPRSLPIFAIFSDSLALKQYVLVNVTSRFITYRAARVIRASAHGRIYIRLRYKPNGVNQCHPQGACARRSVDWHCKNDCTNPVLSALYCTVYVHVRHVMHTYTHRNLTHAQMVCDPTTPNWYMPVLWENRVHPYQFNVELSAIRLMDCTLSLLLWCTRLHLKQRTIILLYPLMIGHQTGINRWWSNNPGSSGWACVIVKSYIIKTKTTPGTRNYTTAFKLHYSNTSNSGYGYHHNQL